MKLLNLYKYFIRNLKDNFRNTDGNKYIKKGYIILDKKLNKESFKNII